MDAEPLTERPEYIPEKLWPEGDGADPDVQAKRTPLALLESVAQAHAHAEAHVGERDEQTTARLTGEILSKLGEEGEIRDKAMAALHAGRPESADAYESKLPESVELPEGMTFEFNQDDPLLAFWKGKAFELGLDQNGFEAGLAEYVQAQLADMPDPAKVVEQLGETGKARLDALDLRLKKLVGDESAGVLMTEARLDAPLAQALEKLLESGAVSPSQLGSVGARGDEAAALRKQIEDLQASDAYWQGDPVTQQRVGELYKKLHGDAKDAVPAS